MVYIPSRWEPAVREWSERYSEVRELLEQISLKCLERLQRRKE
jgi:hypothetical protein